MIIRWVRKSEIVIEADERTHHLRSAPAEDGRGQPPGWPHRAAHPSRLPQMVHVGPK
jgi:hypothetical protein